MTAVIDEDLLNAIVTILVGLIGVAGGVSAQLLGREFLFVARQFGPDVTFQELGARNGVRSTREISIPSDRLMEVVDALLYIYRRAHEHEFQGRPGDSAGPFSFHRLPPKNLIDGRRVHRLTPVLAPE